MSTWLQLASGLACGAEQQLLNGIFPGDVVSSLNHNSIGNDGCSRLAEALRSRLYMEEIK